MRNAVRLAVGAVAIFLATSPVMARHGRPAAAPGRPTFYNPIGKIRRGLANGGAQCTAQTRRCLGNGVGRHRGDGLIGGWVGYGYGGLIEDPESLRDQGFFAGTGDAWAENGRAVYDYDRGYPYDWYRDPGAPAADAGPPPGPPMMRCEVSWVAGTRGARSPVRVCRGRR